MSGNLHDADLGHIWLMDVYTENSISPGRIPCKPSTWKVYIDAN